MPGDNSTSGGVWALSTSLWAFRRVSQTWELLEGSVASVASARLALAGDFLFVFGSLPGMSPSCFAPAGAVREI